MRGRPSHTLRSCALGVALTVAVIAVDLAGGLGALENWLYDHRALNFQYFTPPPTDRLVHLDIDDAALETIGRWPWPRSTLADIVDEVRLAGADVLALDVIFPDPQEPTTVVVEGKPVTVDHDARLAAALGRFGRVLVPVSFTELSPNRSESPIHAAAVEVLRADPSIEHSSVAARIPSALGPLTEDAFLVARRAALARRIQEEVSRAEPAPDAAQVRRRVLGDTAGDVARTSSLARQFETLYRQAESVREVRRFARARPPDCPPLLAGSDPELLPAFARTTRYTGFINDKPSDDGKVRGVPLWVEHEGMIYPQIDLALACAVLGTDPRLASVERDRVTLPLPDGRAMAIPVRTIRLREDGSGAVTRVGAYFDIPWFGGPGWGTMYDRGAGREKKQHVPAALAWGLAESRKTVARNNAEAAAAMAALADAPVQSAAKFLQAAPPPEDVAAWLARAQPVVDDTVPMLRELEQAAGAGLSADERVILNACRAVRDAAQNSRRLLEKSGELNRALAGKVVLVGSTATAALDQRPTSLHAQCPGVVIHGVTFNALVTGQGWHVAPAWATATVTVVLGLLVTAVVTWPSPWKALGGTLVLAGAYAALNAVLLFDYGDRVVGLAGPLVSAAVVWGTLTVVRFVVERKERARITRKFRGYVDPQLVEFVIRHPEISRFEGQVREMTVCFTDLVGFTTMTEQLREQAVPILGRYINRMVTTMRKHRGLLNRLMGDGIMFSYGAPLENPAHAADAVATVIEMHEQLAELNGELAEEGKPQLSLRAGVSTGRVVVGDSGGTEAVDYTCLGDATNLGARLESANKFTGTRTLISARTAELLDGQYLLRPVARLQVAGKRQSVMTFEPLARTEDATDEQRRLVAMTQDLLDHYEAGRFEHCIAAADALDESFGASKLAKLYRDACHRYIEERAPDGFHGQIVLTEK